MTDAAKIDFITIDGCQIRYKRAGKGVPVVLLHGSGTGGLEDWDLTLFSKIAQTNHVIAFDRPGVGQSDRIDRAEDPSVQAAMLKQASQTLGINRPILIGHSYGGIVALAWAISGTREIAGLMPVSAVSMPMDHDVEPILRLIARPVIGPVIAKLACTVLRKKALADAVKKAFSPHDAPDGYMAHIGNTLFTNPVELRNNARELSALKHYLPALSTQYPTLTMPVEIIHGTADATLTCEEHADKLAKIIPNARYSQLEGIGHMPHYLATDKIIGALGRLTEHATGTAG